MPLELGGNDEDGIIAVNSLTRSGVDTSYVFSEEKSTNAMNIVIPNSKLGDNSLQHLWYSPISMEYTMNFSNNLPKEFPSELQENNVYLILDKFLPINLDFLKSIRNKKVCLDIGHIRFFEHFTKQYITNFFKFADFIVLNDSVLDLLFERLDIKSEADFFVMFDLDFLVITKGKKGATFLFKENNSIKSISKVPEVIVDSIDTAGAGDAFFSSILKEYAYTDKLDENFINNTFSIANKASREILMQFGSRKS